jgi:hypothetical protein
MTSLILLIGISREVRIIPFQYSYSKLRNRKGKIHPLAHELTMGVSPAKGIAAEHLQ